MVGPSWTHRVTSTVEFYSMQNRIISAFQVKGPGEGREWWAKSKNRLCSKRWLWGPSQELGWRLWTQLMRWPTKTYQVIEEWLGTFNWEILAGGCWRLSQWAEGYKAEDSANNKQNAHEIQGARGEDEDEHFLWSQMTPGCSVGELPGITTLVLKSSWS